jgi:membrane protease YdiL (CAAX protease family)
MIANVSNDRSSRPWAFAIATLLVLVIVDFLHEILSRFAAYRGLYEHHSFYVPEGIDKIGGVVLCALAVWVLRRVAWKGVVRELGLTDSPLPAMVFALAASSPMLIGFALTRGLPPHMEPLAIFFLTVFSPIVEEIEFRGLGVRNLQRGTGWPFWAIVWPQALLFGWGHVEKGQSFLEMAGLMLMTGTGAVVFAWLVYRWQSLWFPTALHICMNLWWEVFGVAKTSLGGWFPFALQTGTVLLAIGITLYWTRGKAAF